MLLILASCATQTPLSKVNLEYQLDTKLSIQAKSRVWITNDSTFVLTKIRLNSLGREVMDDTLLKKMTITWQLVPSYEVAEAVMTDSVRQRQVFRYSDGDWGLKIHLPKTIQSSTQVWVLTVQDRVAKQIFKHDLFIDLESFELSYHFALQRPHDPYPLVDNYISTDDTIRILTPKQSVYIKHYADPFAPALPAMALTLPAKGPALTATKQLGQSATTINSSGLYTCVADTNTKRAVGFSFVVQQGKFPKVTKPIELVTPLIYITTKEEKKRLGESTAPKLTLDQFWLNIGANPDNARRVIREYYGHVEGANQLFTSYKEGWRTDKGIVYIVFGKPKIVYKTNLVETWIYTAAGTEQQYKFDFTRKPTIFTSDNWELNRFSEYADFWYSTVDSWRRGILKN